MNRLSIVAFCAVLTALTSLDVFAQTATTSVSVGWTAPTTNTDDSTITGTLAYNVYQGPKAGPFVKVASAITSTTDVVSSLSAGSCFAITTVETVGASSVESALSNTSCAIVPGSPSGTSITISVTVK